MTERKTVEFNIQGEYITQMAKEWFFCENRGYDKVMKLLFSCMKGTDQSEKEIRRLAEDILLCRAALVGNVADKTYHMEWYEADEQPECSDSFHVFKKLSNVMEKLKKTERELRKMQEWYSVAMKYVPEHYKNDVLKETGQPFECEYGSAILNSFIERMMDKEKHTTEDYGWLEPNGKFHEVEWGKHQEWAIEYVKEYFPDDYEKIGMQMNTETGFIGAGDFLVEKSWVLLHSPSQGIAEPTRNPVKRYTKAQQEFLYDYYTERNHERKANEIYQEE